MRRLRTGLAALALLLFVGSNLLAQKGDGDRHERARERWESMGEEEQALYRKRFERLRELPPAEREVLLEEAADLERRKRELFDELSPESKRRLAELSPERRELILREYFDESERVRGLRLREQLPPEFLEKLESVPPGERRVLMRDYHRRLSSQAGERMLGTMRRELELSPERLRELSKLPENERRRAMLELKRESIREHVERRGLPPGISAEEWKELDGLPFDEFFLRWGHRREFDPERERSERGPRRAGPPFDRGGPPRGPGGSRPDRREERGPRFGPDHSRGERGRHIDELFRLAHPSLDDLLEFAELEPKERRAAVAGLVRERCLDYLKASPVLDPTELERLRVLPPDDFVREVRSLLGEARGGRWRGPEAGKPRAPSDRRPLRRESR